MPNWCVNELIVFGSKESLELFEDTVLEWPEESSKKFLGDVVFNFEKIAPTPEELREEQQTEREEPGSLDKESAYKALVNGEGYVDPNFPMLIPNADKLLKQYPEKNVKIFNNLVFRTASFKNTTVSALALSLEKAVVKIVQGIEKHGCSSWYDWRIKHWGTKWSACQATVVRKIKNKDDSQFAMFLSFNTAWTPPKPLIYDYLTKMFTDTLFCLKYWERGAGFKGVYTVRNSVILASEDVPYSGSRGG